MIFVGVSKVTSRFLIRRLRRLRRLFKSFQVSLKNNLRHQRYLRMKYVFRYTFFN